MCPVSKWAKVNATAVFSGSSMPLGGSINRLPLVMGRMAILRRAVDESIFVRDQSLQKGPLSRCTNNGSECIVGITVLVLSRQLAHGVALFLVQVTGLAD